MRKSNFEKCPLLKKIRKVINARIGCRYKHGTKVLIVNCECMEKCKLKGGGNKK